MIGSKRTSRKISIYCEHSAPCYEDSRKVKDELKVCGHKVFGRSALFILGFLTDTVWLILSILNFFAGLFGKHFLEITDETIKNDYRCENCKKEAGGISQ